MLARNGVAPVGDLRYIADTKLDDIATPIAKAQLAAALAMLGDKTRADRVYLAALDAIAGRSPKLDLGRADYGSTLRDCGGAGDARLGRAGDAKNHRRRGARIDAARALITSRTSTQEDAWLVLAARALVKQVNAISLAVNGETRQGAFYRSLRADRLDAPLAVSNKGAGTVQAVVSVSGSPTTPEPAAERGFKIERSYFTLDGEPADPANTKQNQRFVVVLKMTEPQPAIWPGNRRRLSAGRFRDRQSASGVVGRYRHAGVDHRRRRAGEQRIPRRPLHRGVRSRR